MQENEACQHDKSIQRTAGNCTLNKGRKGSVIALSNKTENNNEEIEMIKNKMEMMKVKSTIIKIKRLLEGLTCRFNLGE